MKILLIEDQYLLASTLISVLQQDENIEIVGQSDKASEAVNLCEKLQPDIVIMDVYTKEGNGIEYTAHIKKRFPKIKVLVITGMEDERLVKAAEEAGADFFAWKNVSLDDLLEFIYFASKPYRVFPSTGMQKSGEISLSAIDIQIINLLAKGKNSRDIADELYLSYGTVRLYISRMYTATGLKSRAQLVAYALRSGLIEPV